MRSGQTLIGFLAPRNAENQIGALTAAGVQAFAVESIPRISRAQVMDALSSQANVAGYKAVLVAASESTRFFPMLTTAAGTVKPVPTQTITTTPQIQGDTGTKPAEPPAPPKQAVPLVAQKAILYEEGKAGAQALITSGKVVWQVVPDPTVGKDGAVMLRVRAEIPDRKMVVNLSMRPNADASFPASHLVEIKFQVPSDFDGKAVTGVPALIMKATEQARGDPLVAASAKVADNFFWIALGSGEAEKERNFKLLKERGWIDVPLLYENGRRAILTLEKAGSGDQALADAMTAWGQGG